MILARQVARLLLKLKAAEDENAMLRVELAGYRARGNAEVHPQPGVFVCVETGELMTVNGECRVHMGDRCLVSPAGLEAENAMLRVENERMKRLVGQRAADMPPCNDASHDSQCRCLWDAAVGKAAP